MPETPHPHPNELLAYHFAEASPAERKRIEQHVESCAPCGTLLRHLADISLALAGTPDEEPPADGLERVLLRIGHARPARERRAAWLTPVLTSLAGVAAGGLAIYASGAHLLSLPGVEQLPLFPAIKTLSGFALAALAFFGLGSLVTLALAPALIIESELQQRPLAAR
jgi:anti-sigma factor RsiW